MNRVIHFLPLGFGVVVLVTGSAICTGITNYLAGLTNRAAFFLGLHLATLALFTIGLGGLGITLLAGIRLRCAHLWFVSSLGLFAGGLILGYILFLQPPGYTRFVDGFSDRILKRGDLACIRAWVGALPPGAKGPVLKEEWPKCLTELEPNEVQFDGEQSCRVEWGGGWATWGLVVSMRPATPESSSQLYVRRLDEHSYVYHILQ